MSRQRTFVVVAGIMLSLFMASMEATVISTAMPTIVSQLGGFEIYSWAFAAYMLTSTCTVPIYGKLSDIYGRRIVYAVAMSLFLVGSVLCGLSQSMEQLIFFRAVQGIGAGGVLPLVFIIIGDIFSFEQRARMQGFFSGVWGISSIVGPVLGGFLVDRWSWHWVFYVNVLPGAVALALVWLAWQDDTTRKRPVAIDYAGAGLLILSVVVLLLGLNDVTSTLGMVLLVVALVLFVLLIIVERRSPEPILPLPLFRDRLFLTATLSGALAGWAMFGSLSYVPLFVQTVLGTTATEAGTTLTPMMLGWVLASIVGGRLLLKIGYRTVAYSARNRSAACRIPVYSQSPKAKRIEFRCPDPAANPYLAFAACLMAGLDGIKNQIDPGGPAEQDLFEEETLRHVTTVKGSLDAVLDALEQDNAYLLEGDVFTSDLIETYVSQKRIADVDAVRLRPHPHEFVMYYGI